MIEKLKKLRNGETVNAGLLFYFDLQPCLVEGEKLEYCANLEWNGGPDTWTYFLKRH